MWIASLTKLMTSIAVLQCVEQGLVQLDDDATITLHELREVEVLTGFNGDLPILEKKTALPTARLVLIPDLYPV